MANTDIVISKARNEVQKAFRRGDLIRPESCQLCGDTPEKRKKPLIVAHHWRGYEYPLDVWWICNSCNVTLRFCHDGTLQKEDARLLIATTRNGGYEPLPPLLVEALTRAGKSVYIKRRRQPWLQYNRNGKVIP